MTLKFQDIAVHGVPLPRNTSRSMCLYLSIKCQLLYCLG